MPARNDGGGSGCFGSRLAMTALGIGHCISNSIDLFRNPNTSTIVKYKCAV